jgi:hypothetical protein
MTTTLKPFRKAAGKAKQTNPARHADHQPEPNHPRPADDLLALDLKDPLSRFDLSEGQERQAILNSANPALREVLAQVGHWLLKESRDNILNRYALGALLRRVYQDEREARGSVYGAGAIDKIRRFFHWDEGTAYHALRVAEAFTREEVERLAALRLANGRPLYFGHLLNLAAAPEGDRAALLERVLSESMTVGELHQHVHRIRPKEQPAAPETRGRPLAVPRNLDALLRQQGNLAKDFLNRDREV